MTIEGIKMSERKTPEIGDEVEFRRMRDPKNPSVRGWETGTVSYVSPHYRVFTIELHRPGAAGAVIRVASISFDADSWRYRQSHRGRR